MICGRCGGRTRKTKCKNDNLCTSCSKLEEEEQPRKKRKISTLKNNSQHKTLIKSSSENGKNEQIKDLNEEKPKVNWESLPIELWYEILSYLPMNTLYSFAISCKKLKEISNIAPLWSRVSNKEYFITHSIFTNANLQEYSRLVIIHNQKVEEMIENLEWQQLYFHKLEFLCVFCKEWAGFSEKKYACIICLCTVNMRWKHLIIEEIFNEQNIQFRKLFSKPTASEIYDSLISRFGDIPLYQKFEKIIWNIVSRTQIYYFPIKNLNLILPEMPDQVERFKSIFFDEKIQATKKLNATIDFINFYRHSIYTKELKKPIYDPIFHEMIEEQINIKQSHCFDTLQKYKLYQHLPNDEIIPSLIESLLKTITPKTVVIKIREIIKYYWIQDIAPTFQANSASVNSQIDYLAYLLPESQSFLMNGLLSTDEFNFDLFNKSKLEEEILAIKRFAPSQTKCEIACRLMVPPKNVNFSKLTELIRSIEQEAAVRDALLATGLKEPKNKRPKSSSTYKLYIDM